MNIPSKSPSGLVAFTIVWLGQLVSLLGTGMTNFALTIWAFQLTGQATTLALMGFFTFLPSTLLSPIAGALVDRWNRKLVMMLSDLAAGLASIVILLLYFGDQLQVWHLYVAGAFSGSFQAFQFPAYSASVTLMLPKSQYARASGMLSLARSASNVGAPLLAGVLLSFIGIGGVLVIDIITFLFALGVLLLVHIPQPPQMGDRQSDQNHLLKDAVFGFRYIASKPSLLGLQLVFFAINLIITFGFTVLAPMVLARTDNDELILGAVQSAAGVGGVLGGVALSVWGGPKRRALGLLLSLMLANLGGYIWLGIGRELVVWSVGAVIVAFFFPITNGASQAIWQSKVAPEIQGRVFSARRVIASISTPIAMLLAGPLADRVFEPAFRSMDFWTKSLMWLVGTGPGAGMGLMIVIAGVLGAVVALVGLLLPVIRNVETLLPDHEMAAAET